MLAIPKQQLQSLKERNLALKENFNNYLKKEKATKKFKEFVIKQDILFNDLDENIDKLITNGNRPLEPSDEVDHDGENSQRTIQLADHSLIGNLINSPGLKHLAENIFLNLDYQVLETCQNVNATFQQFLDDPMFWIKRFIQRGLSKKNQDDWTEAIQMTRDGRAKPDLEKNILLFLKRYSKNKKVVDFDVPCYLNDEAFLKKAPELIKSFNCDCDETIKKTSKGKVKSFKCDCIDEIKKFLSKTRKKGKEAKKKIDFSSKYPYFDENSDNVKYEIERKWTIFHDMAQIGNMAVMQLLAPLTKNPNPANSNGRTPIYLAAQQGNSDVIKILAPLTYGEYDLDPNYSSISFENPQSRSDTFYSMATPPKENGRTPMHVAAINGNVEIIKILAPLTDPYPHDDDWVTPIEIARDEGNQEIVQILAPLANSESKSESETESGSDSESESEIY